MAGWKTTLSEKQITLSRHIPLSRHIKLPWHNFYTFSIYLIGLQS